MFPIIPNRIVVNSSGSESASNSSPYRSDKNLWSSVWNNSVGCKINVKKEFHKIPPKMCRASSNKSVTISDTNDRDGIFATTFIPKGVTSMSINKINYTEIQQIYEKNRQINLSVNNKGTLVATTNNNYDGNSVIITENLWIPMIRLSNDVHSNNAIIEITAGKEIRVRIVNDIEQRQEILLWFSEETLAFMCIPFLTPANIRGKNCYTCNTCEKIYENPNPLKIHIATNCERESILSLWKRLELSLQSTREYLLAASTSLYTPTTTTIAQQCWTMVNQQRLSAFQPVIVGGSSNNKYPIQITSSSSSSTSSSVAAAADALSVASAASTAADSLMYDLPGSASTRAATAAAHLETIVSNMGTSKQGHLCIYCGKLYSRKYGLKIHIRTHTGFKPLKCKFCLRPFGDPSNLNKHVRLHVQGNTVYKCDECDKILVRRRDLQRHMRSRHRSIIGAVNDGGEMGKVNVIAGQSSSSSGLSSDDDT